MVHSCIAPVQWNHPWFITKRWNLARMDTTACLFWPLWCVCDNFASKRAGLVIPSTRLPQRKGCKRLLPIWILQMFKIGLLLLLLSIWLLWSQRNVALWCLVERVWVALHCHLHILHILHWHILLHVDKLLLHMRRWLLRLVVVETLTVLV